MILTFSSKLPVYLDLVRCDLRDRGDRDLELEVLLCRRLDLDQDLEDDRDDLREYGDSGYERSKSWVVGI